jgi:hypothetical protein
LHRQSSHFQKYTPQRISCMIPGYNNGVSNPENLCLSSRKHVSAQGFNVRHRKVLIHYVISNLPQKDLIPVIFVDSARLYVHTPHGFVRYRPKMAVHQDPLSTV